ncbi:MAG: LacI family DNA-binding transcriptional regulator [Pseudothermotoga sp.]
MQVREAHLLRTRRVTSVTLRDIASSVGVSVSTVSRALNNNPRISEHTRNTVILMAKLLGYTLNERKYLKTIALVIINPHKGSIESDEFFSSVQKGVIDISTNSGVPCLINIVQPENPVSFNVPTEIVDGIIIGGIPMPSFVKRLLESTNLPTVMVGKYQDLEHLPSINNDNVRGGYLAGLEIIHHGYRNVVILSGPLKICTFADRVEGAMSAFRRNNLSIDKVRVIECNDFDEKSGRQAVLAQKEYFRTNAGTAILATTDWLAKGALDALKAMRIAVPQEIGIIGFGGLQMCHYTTPPLTSVKLNPYLIGKIAFTVLSELIAGSQESGGTVFVEPTILRGGTLCQQ